MKEAQQLREEGWKEGDLCLIINTVLFYLNYYVNQNQNKHNSMLFKKHL